MLHPAATLEDLYTTSEDDMVDQVLAHGLDALITTVVSTPVLHALVSEGLPVICLAESDFHHPLFTSVSSLYDGGVMAGRYVGEKLGGHGHVPGVTAGLEKVPTKGQSRFAGFCDGLKDSPSISVAHIPAYWSYAQAYPALLTALNNYPHRIDAIFGVSDSVILAARDAGRKLGIIDQNTVLVGLNGDTMALAAVAEGDLSATIDTAAEELGAAAA